MKADFYSLYKTYSNVELLKIVKQPEDYQEEAVATAEEILKERLVLDEEIKSAELELLGIPSHFYTTSTEGSTTEEGDILTPLLTLKAKTERPSWIKIALAVIALSYAYVFYSTARLLWLVLRCEMCSLGASDYIGIFLLVYLPLVFYFIYQRKPLGWILLFVDNLFAFISRGFNAYMIYNFQHSQSVLGPSLFIGLLIKLAILLFLWRTEVAGYFSVDQETKLKTAVLTFLGTAVFIALLFWVR